MARVRVYARSRHIASAYVVKVHTNEGVARRRLAGEGARVKERRG
jgi:hypothetical protein